MLVVIAEPVVVQLSKGIGHIALAVVGAAIGAASGALGGALSDFGINDKFMKELAESIQPGNAALFVLINKMTADKVLAEISGAGGVVLKTSLDQTKEQALRDALAQHAASPVAAAAVAVDGANPALNDSHPVANS